MVETRCRTSGTLGSGESCISVDVSTYGFTSTISGRIRKMSTEKFVIWNNTHMLGSNTLCKLHLLTGYALRTLENYNYFFEQMKSDFDCVNQGNAICSIVHKSDRYENNLILAWSGYLDRKELVVPAGWKVVEHDNPLVQYTFL
jgi:hypothetical protein